MTASTESHQFVLSLQMDINVPEEYDALVTNLELVRGVYNTITLVFINESDQEFPGCELTIGYREYGPNISESSLQWSYKEALQIPSLAPNESHLFVQRISPIIDGILELRLQVLSVNAEGEQVNSVVIRGQRFGETNTPNIQMCVVPRESLDLQIKISQLINATGGKADATE